MQQNPYLNLGCGRIILPRERPIHHAAIDEAIYSYPLYVNVDRNPQPGVDEVVDLFTYPWPFETNSFDGALLSHLVEHIPHEIRVRGDGERAAQLLACQDGWYAFFAELYRVLTPGAVAHVLCPYAWSQGAMTDPTHTRYVTEHTFSHSTTPDPDSPFKYNTAGLHFELVGAAGFTLYPAWSHLVPKQGDDPAEVNHKGVLLTEAIRTHINVAMEVYVKLRAVK